MRINVSYLICSLAAAVLLGCASGHHGTAKGDNNIIPRKEIISPPAKSSVGRNFSPAKFQNLAIVCQATPGRIINPHYPRAAGAEKLSRIVEDEFVAALLKKGYTVASRRDVELALKEAPIGAGFDDKDAGP